MDYVNLLMIGQAIRAKNIDQNVKKHKRPPKSLKNKMFIFGLRSISDDQASVMKSSKNQMFIFGLNSTSDDQPINLSKKCQPNC